MKGIYVLLLGLDEAIDIPVGARRRYVFRNGYYSYVGSALSGLEHRIRRHLSSGKKRYWHIDYLLEIAGIHNIICAETEERKECLLAHALSVNLPAVKGFGCSDCRCRSHLFYCSNRQELENITVSAFRELDLVPFSFTTT